MARTPKVVEDRREHIIDAAMRVFSQKGFTKATNKDIAREAGITPGLIYYYFESKEALLKAIIETRSPVQLLNSPPQQMFELPPEMFLRFLIQRVLGIVETENFIRLARMLLPEIVHSPEMASMLTAIFQRVLGFIGGYLDEKMQRGELRRIDVALASQAILGTVMGFVLRRQILKDPAALQYSHEQIAQSVVEAVLQGLLPR